jgi:Histidinol-phosphate/aromatic aminotransferase and cobyric acid decarboxylase
MKKIINNCNMNFPKAKKINIQRYEGGLSKIAGITNPIKLSSNESALGCSPAAAKAIDKIKKIFKYPDSNSSLLKNSWPKYLM